MQTARTPPDSNSTLRCKAVFSAFVPQPNRFGESDMTRQLRTWMLGAGFTEEQVNLQLTRLIYRPSDHEKVIPTEVAESGAEQDEIMVDKAFDPADINTVKAGSRLVSDARAAPQYGNYVISVQSRSRFRRLHRVGGCWRQAGRDFKEFQVMGVQLPGTDSYDAPCIQCFKDFNPNEEVDSDAASSGSSSDVEEEWWS